jgi:hypothetical protein
MLWVCGECLTFYAADLAACPHCEGTDRVAKHDVDAWLSRQGWTYDDLRDAIGKGEIDVANKITVAGGPSFEGDDPRDPMQKDATPRPGEGLGRFQDVHDASRPQDEVEAGADPEGDQPPESRNDPGVADTDVPEQGDGPAVEYPPAPARTASKSDWVEFANAVNRVDVALAEENPEPETLTKDELVRRYGSLTGSTE